MTFEVRGTSYSQWKAQVNSENLAYTHVYAGALETSVSHLFVYIYAGNQDTVISASLDSGSADEVDWYSNFEPTSDLFASTEDAVSSLQFIVSNTGQVITDGVDIADVLDLTNSNPLAVAIVDANGDQIASFGGGTQYTEDAVAVADPVGTAPILIRKDTPSAVTSTDGDNVAQRGTNYGAAYVQVVSSSGSFVDTFGGGTQYTEDAVAVADPTGNIIIAVRADTPSAITSTDGDNIAIRATNKGEQYVANAISSQVDGHSLSIGATSDADTALTVIGRLKQTITRLAGGLPAALVGGRLDINIGTWLGSLLPTIGSKPMAESIPVTMASDQTIVVSSAAANAVTGITFGRILTTTSAKTLIAVRSTPYTEPLANFTGSIISSSASDSAAGVGARTVKIYYLDATGATAGTETVTLNGTTSVPLVNANKCFIEKMEVLTNGSTGWNVGTITLRNDAVATVGSIGIGNGIVADSPANVGHEQTFWGHHYIPAGKTASLYTLTGGTNGNQSGTCFLKVARPLVADSSELQITDFRQIPLSSGESQRHFENAVVIVGFARVTAYVISEGTNTRFAVAFDWSEVDT